MQCATNVNDDGSECPEDNISDKVDDGAALVEHLDWT
jgi:hypothetical protein